MMIMRLKMSNMFYYQNVLIFSGENPAAMLNHVGTPCHPSPLLFTCLLLMSSIPTFASLGRSLASQGRSLGSLRRSLVSQGGRSVSTLVASPLWHISLSPTISRCTTPHVLKFPAPIAPRSLY